MAAALKRAAVAACALAVLACAAPRPRVVFDRASPYGRVLVSDEGPRRVMRFGTLDASEQSAIVRDDPRAVPIEYMRYALLALAYHGNPRRLLMVGLGGGTLTGLVQRARPDVRVDVVELDPVVVDAARACFGLREDATHRVHVADGARWMAAARESYDVIVLDAYLGEELPSALASEAFFRDVRARLAPGGVVALNVAELRGGMRAAARAMAAVLSPFACKQAPTDGNLVLFAAATATAPDPRAAQRWAEAWDQTRATSFSLASLLRAPPGADCAQLTPWRAFSLPAERGEGPHFSGAAPSP